jgi:hypothetical protein
MNKKILFALALVLIVGAGFYLLRSGLNTLRQNQAVRLKMQAPYNNATYIIEGRSVTLNKGYAEAEAAPGSASKTITRYFGNEVWRDFDNDGREDIIFLVTQETGGSGKFFYVVAALQKESGYVGSKGAYFLGDRIAPQSSYISQNPRHKDVVVVNYADRAPGESFAVRPSVGKSAWLKFDPETMQFGIVVQDFEGESNQ